MTSWDPFDFMRDLQDDMNRVFRRSLARPSEGTVGLFESVLDVREEGDKFIVEPKGINPVRFAAGKWSSEEIIVKKRTREREFI
jgi:hypothetical protein